MGGEPVAGAPSVDQVRDGNLDSWEARFSPLIRRLVPTAVEHCARW